jgi:hypothetical protein
VVTITTIKELEVRVEAIETVIVEMNALIKILKPIAIILAAGVGMDISVLL